MASLLNKICNSNCDFKKSSLIKSIKVRDYLVIDDSPTLSMYDNVMLAVFEGWLRSTGLFTSSMDTLLVT